MDKVMRPSHTFHKSFEGIKQVTEKIRFRDKHLNSPIKRKIFGRGGKARKAEKTALKYLYGRNKGKS